MIEIGIRSSCTDSGRKSRSARRTAPDPAPARMNADTSAIPTYFQTNDSAPLK